MKKIMSRNVLSLGILSLLITVSTLGFVKIAETSYSDLLTNGDFEKGTLEGWSVYGDCSISNTVVHNGSYSAFVSQSGYDNSISQNLDFMIDYGVHFDGWVYPWYNGSLGAVQYPSSGIILKFFFKSTMQFAFEIGYIWCWNLYNENATNSLLYWVPMERFQWNFLSRNVTHEAYSYFQSVNFSDVTLSSITAWYHFSSVSPGAFYLDDLRLLKDSELLGISEVNLFPTCPKPYVASNVTRVNEPVLVKANVTDTRAVDAILRFRRQGEKWFNCSMVFNETENLWTQTIPGEPENCTVELFIEARDAWGNSGLSPILSYDVKALLAGDINGDGIIDIFDLVIVALDFGKTS